jgi:hypothetical protein
MRVFALLFIVIGISMVSFSQTPIPGTFSTLPAQAGTAINAPVLETPIATLNNGFTPGTVTNQATYVVFTPQSMFAPTLSNPYSAEDAGAETASSAAGDQGTGTTMVSGRRRYFDFVVASDGSTTYDTPMDESRSLAEMASSVRRAPHPAGHVYTNDDIARMNQKYGSANNTSRPVMDASSDN